MKVYKIIRDPKPEATPGVLVDNTGKKIICTLEPPNRNNAKDNPNTAQNEAGCIPEGEYLCFRRDPIKYKNSRFKNNWEISGVPNKTGVVFHAGNYWFQSQSCILLGTEIKNMDPRNEGKINPDQKWFANKSREAVKHFNSVMPEKFKLIITSIK